MRPDAGSGQTGPGSHLIVYLAQDNGISVIRILHENMDVDGHLE